MCGCGGCRLQKVTRGKFPMRFQLYSTACVLHYATLCKATRQSRTPHNACCKFKTASAILWRLCCCNTSSTVGIRERSTFFWFHLTDGSLVFGQHGPLDTSSLHWTSDVSTIFCTCGNIQPRHYVHCLRRQESVTEEVVSRAV